MLEQHQHYMIALFVLKSALQQPYLQRSCDLALRKAKLVAAHELAHYELDAIIDLFSIVTMEVLSLALGMAP